MGPEIYAIILFVLVIGVFLSPISTSIIALLLPVYCIVTGLAPLEKILPFFADKTLWLVFCMQMFGLAIFEVGLADKIGNKLYSAVERTKFKDKEKFTLALVLAVAGLCSTVLQNLGVTLAFMPVVIAIARKTGVSRTKLLMILAIATGLGGASTLVGTPMHAVINGVLNENGVASFGMFDYTWTALPIWVIGGGILVFFNKYLLPERYKEVVDHSSALESAEIKGTPYQQAVVGIGYLLFILAIIFKKQTGIPEAAAGMALIAIMALLKGLPIETLIKGIKVPFLLEAGCLLAMVSIMGSSGAAELIAAPVISILGADASPRLVIAVFFLLAAVLTQFMVNQYTATLLVPIALGFASSVGMAPEGIVMAVLMGCNCCFCTPTATTANLVVMDDGKIKFIDYLKPGLVMMAVGLIVNVVVLPIIWY